MLPVLQERTAVVERAARSFGLCLRGKLAAQSRYKQPKPRRRPIKTATHSGKTHNPLKSIEEHQWRGRVKPTLAV